MAPVTQSDIQRAAGDLGLSGRPLCVHSSLRSFGHVEGGARTVIDGLLAAGCTVMVPTFTYHHETSTPAGVRIERNGEDLHRDPSSVEDVPCYVPDENLISEDMGAIPRALLQMPDRVRGAHPIDSFAAVGPLADALISGQTPQDVYAPFRALIEHDGLVVLMGVGLNRMTLIHNAEARAGRNLFRRWARGVDGCLIETRVGGCSEGFPNLEPALAHLVREAFVGKSRWQVYPAGATIEAAAAAIRENPRITHCSDPACARCNDAVAGGPKL